MAVVLVVSAIAATTSVAVAMNSYNSFVNGRRQSLAEQARETAEAGVNILVEELNRNHPEWLIENYSGTGQWSLVNNQSGGCRLKPGVNPKTEGVSTTFSNGNEGKYKLNKYEFEGNQYYGGKGTFEVTGEIRSSNNKLLASAKVYQDMSILTKGCDELPGDTANQEGIWPAIFIDSEIRRYANTRAIMKGTDPAVPAKVMCKKGCDQGPWKDTPNELSIGNVEMPKTPAVPKDLTGISNDDFEDLVKGKLKDECKNFRIPEDLPNNAKKQDEDGTWHVYVQGAGTATLNGSSGCSGEKRSIKISNTGPVRVYMDGSLRIQDKTWIDTSAVKHATDFMILGTAQTGQKVDIYGDAPDSQALKTFIWLPNGEAKFRPKKKKMTIEGGIWADTITMWGTNLVKSIDVVVPEDMAQMVYQRLGKEMGIGQRDYVAQGITGWKSYANAR